MKKNFCISQGIIFLFVNLCAPLFAWQKMVVTKPVVNFYAKPVICFSKRRAPLLFKDNPHQISQLLLGEKIYAEKDACHKGWLRVQAIEQQVYARSLKKFVACRGYIKQGSACTVGSFPSHNLVVVSPWATLWRDRAMKRQLMRVTLGTMFKGKKINSVYQVQLARNQKAYVACGDLDTLFGGLTARRAESLVRKNLVDKMKIAIGSPYLWGGRSIWDPSIGLLTGVDCSSLINLVYRSQGINLPRNSLSQFLFAKKIDSGRKLRPGDLVFVSKKKNPMQGISHVMMYAHNNKFIEASAHASRLRGKVNRLNSLRTRIVSDKLLFGKSYTQLASGEKIMKGSRKEEYVFFASPLGGSFKGNL